MMRDVHAGARWRPGEDTELARYLLNGMQKLSAHIYRYPHLSPLTLCGRDLANGNLQST